MLNELQNEWNEWVSLLNTLLMLKNPFGDKAISPYHDLGSYPVYCISLKFPGLYYLLIFPSVIHMHLPISKNYSQPLGKQEG